ncbi:MAG: hypothetical protein ABIG71_03960 [Candidatus Uhrbacteria bacterium]
MDVFRGFRKRAQEVEAEAEADIAAGEPHVEAAQRLRDKLAKEIVEVERKIDAMRTEVDADQDQQRPYIEMALHALTEEIRRHTATLERVDSSTDDIDDSSRLATLITLRDEALRLAGSNAEEVEPTFARKVAVTLGDSADFADPEVRAAQLKDLELEHQQLTIKIHRIEEKLAAVANADERTQEAEERVKKLDTDEVQERIRQKVERDVDETVLFLREIEQSRDGRPWMHKTDAGKFEPRMEMIEQAKAFQSIAHRLAEIAKVGQLFEPELYAELLELLARRNRIIQSFEQVQKQINEQQLQWPLAGRAQTIWGEPTTERESQDIHELQLLDLQHKIAWQYSSGPGDVGKTTIQMLEEANLTEDEAHIIAVTAAVSGKQVIFSNVPKWKKYPWYEDATNAASFAKLVASSAQSLRVKGHTNELLSVLSYKIARNNTLTRREYSGLIIAFLEYTHMDDVSAEGLFIRNFDRAIARPIIEHAVSEQLLRGNYAAAEALLTYPSDEFDRTETFSEVLRNIPSVRAAFRSYLKQKQQEQGERDPQEFELDQPISMLNVFQNDEEGRKEAQQEWDSARTRGLVLHESYRIGYRYSLNRDALFSEIQDQVKDVMYETRHCPAHLERSLRARFIAIRILALAHDQRAQNGTLAGIEFLRKMVLANETHHDGETTPSFRTSLEDEIREMLIEALDEVDASEKTNGEAKNSEQQDAA